MPSRSTERPDEVALRVVGQSSQGCRSNQTILPGVAGPSQSDESHPKGDSPYRGSDSWATLTYGLSGAFVSCFAPANHREGMS